MIGWESGSLGYHGDDGKMFLGSEWGRRYADGYGVNDTIVCKVKVGDGQRKVSFLKNNKPLGKWSFVLFLFCSFLPVPGLPICT